MVDSFRILNTYWWFFDRLIIGTSGQLTTLFIFWKKRTPMSKLQMATRKNMEESHFFGSVVDNYLDENLTARMSNDSSTDNSNSEVLVQ